MANSVIEMLKEIKEDQHAAINYMLQEGKVDIAERIKEKHEELTEAIQVLEAHAHHNKVYRFGGK